MKPFIIILSLFFFMGKCNSDPRTITFNSSPTIIIDKETHDIPDLNTRYCFKIYNGKDTEWVITNVIDYNHYRVNDTITNFTIKDY